MKEDYMEHKRYNKKPRKPFYKPKEETIEDKVVYRTKDDGPKKYADWQLKLRAIADIMGKDVEDFNKAVEARYQELIHRQG